MNKLAVLVAIGCLSGCATIIAGGPDQIPIATNPPGAYVYLDGQVVGQTPMVVTLDRRRSSADIRLYYPGFEPVQINRYKSLNAWVIGNFFIGIFPVIVDLITGDWQRYDDHSVAIGLTPGAAAPPYGMQPQMPMAPQPQPMQPMPPQQQPQYDPRVQPPAPR